MIRWRAALLCCWTGIGPALADVDDSSYDARGVVRSASERQKLQQQFAVEQAAETAAEAALKAEQQKARDAAAAREAARPYPERLTEQRCTTSCHPATNYTNQRHTWLGWTLVVKRMAILNKARIPAPDQPVIIDHLAATYPAGREAQIVEVGLPFLGLTALAALVRLGLGGLRLRRRWRRRKEI